MSKGIDVSAWNTKVDYKALKKAGYDFVMVRLGYGELEDQEAANHIKGAKAAGMHIGGYWFLYATNTVSARANAAACIKFLDKYKGTFDYPIALDFEADSIRYCRQYGGICGKTNYTNMCNEFLHTVEDADYYVSIYANLSDLDKLYQSVTARFDLWLAQWGVKAPARKCGMWQYSDTGSAFKGDQNIAYYDYPKIIKENKLNHLEDKPKTKTVTYTVKKGDTLSGIAAKYGLDWRKVAKENKMENPDLIYPGQKIKLKGVKA